MKIAILSDIHANFCALFSVLQDAKVAILKFYTDVQVRKALKAKLQKDRNSFSVGDYVWYYRMGRAGFKDQWVGPARVLARNGRLTIIQ